MGYSVEPSRHRMTDKPPDETTIMPSDTIPTTRVALLVGGAVFAVAVAGVLGFFTGTLEITAEHTYEVTEHAMYAGLGALAIALFFGGRDLGDMETWEVGAVGAAVVSLLSAEHIEQVADIVAENEPHAGLALAGVSVLGYWVASDGLGGGAGTEGL